MKNKSKFYLTVAVVIILFDITASFVSKSLGFDYTSLAWISSCLYIASGYFGCKFYGLTGSILAGLVAGMTDSTIGWWLSSVAGAYIPFEQPQYTFLLTTKVIVMVSMEATIFGMLGGILHLITSKRARLTGV